MKIENLNKSIAETKYSDTKLNEIKFKRTTYQSFISPIKKRGK